MRASSLHAGRSDRRSLLLLVLAIMPILVTGWFSLNQWTESGRELSAIDAAVEPVSTGYTAYEMFDLLRRVEMTFEAAALPGASDEIIELAHREREALDEQLPDAIGAFAMYVPVFAVQLGQTEEVAQSLLDTTTDLTSATIESHEIGEPVPPILDLVLRPASDGLVDMSPIMFRSNVDDLSMEEQLLLELIRLDHTYDLDILSVLRAQANPETLGLANLRLPTWNVDLRTWTLDLQQLDPGRAINEMMAVGSLANQDNPLAPPLLILADQGIEPSSDRDAALVTLFENDLELRRSRAQVYDDFIAAAERRVEVLDRGRTQAAVAGVAMTVLGLALFWLVVSEVVERRRVARAHGEALSDIAELANTDALTGLRNRRWLDGQLPQRLMALDPGEEVVIAYLDVDRFKMINDVWGHHNGDLILQVVAERLLTAVKRRGDMEIVRFGGDEFVAITCMPASTTVSELEAIGADLLAAFDEPVSLVGRQCDIEGSIGIAISEAGSTVHTLLVDADLSMLQAKRSGRGRVVVDKRGTGRVGELVQIIPQALADGEFSMVLQPVVEASSGAVHHYEALARWTRPSGEVIAPSVFVPLVETFGLAEDLTRAMLENVAELVRAEGPGLPRIWINVSPVEFNGPDLSGRILRILRELEIAPTAIGIEMTERSAIGDVIGVEDELQELRSRGIEIAIDDFGAGYSPLGHLRDMPVDALKIDRSLIAGIDTDPGAQQIVRGIAGFARSLGLMLVAEGVERTEERELLRAEGIDLLQGWLLGRPGPAATVLERGRLSNSPPTSTGSTPTTSATGVDSARVKQRQLGTTCRSETIADVPEDKSPMLNLPG